MRSCKDIFELLSEQPVDDLPLKDRLAVRFHFLACRFCRRYKRQIRTIELLLNGTPDSEEGRLTPQIKRRIQKRLEKERT